MHTHISYAISNMLIVLTGAQVPAGSDRRISGTQAGVCQIYTYTYKHRHIHILYINYHHMLNVILNYTHLGQQGCNSGPGQIHTPSAASNRRGVQESRAQGICTIHSTLL